MQPASAAPPFVTDDADIAGAGELEIELWFDGVLDDSGRMGLLTAQLGYGPTEGLELAIGGGLGMESGPSLTVPSPYAQAKYRLLGIVDSGRPGLAITGALAPAIGRGSARLEASAAHLMMPITFSFRDEGVLLHGNLGLIGAWETEELRLFWGLGVDWAIGGSKLRAMAEVFAGDTFDPGDASIGSQLGLIWGFNDQLFLDFAVGTAFEDELGDPLEWTIRLGLTWVATLLDDAE